MQNVAVYAGPDSTPCTAQAITRAAPASFSAFAVAEAIARGGAERREFVDPLMAMLTGDEASIKALTDAAGFHYAWDAGTQQFAHASGVVVVNSKRAMLNRVTGTLSTKFDSEGSNIHSIDANYGKKQFGVRVTVAIMALFVFANLTVIVAEFAGRSMLYAAEFFPELRATRGEEKRRELGLAAGEAIGTALVAGTPKHTARKQWMVDHLQLRGAVGQRRHEVGLLRQRAVDKGHGAPILALAHQLLPLQPEPIRRRPVEVLRRLQRPRDRLAHDGPEQQRPGVERPPGARARRPGPVSLPRPAAGRLPHQHPGARRHLRLHAPRQGHDVRRGEGGCRCGRRAPPGRRPGRAARACCAGTGCRRP